MRRIYNLIIGTLLMGCSTLVLATPLSYSTLDLDYVDSELDPFDGDGFSIDLSGSIHDHFFLKVAYSEVDTEISGFELDVERTSLGVGFHASPGPEKLDMYTQITYEDVQAESDLDRFDADDGGFGVEVGARFAIMPKLELYGAVRYLDVSDYFDGDVGGSAGVVFDLTKWLGLNLEYDYNNITLNGDRGEDERIMAGVRIHWSEISWEHF